MKNDQEQQSTTLLRYQDTCPSRYLSLASQIQAMQANDLASQYSDFRSPSRARQQAFRKQRACTTRRTRCSGRCDICSPPHLHNRRRRLRAHVEECNDEAYWDERLARLDHDERIMYADVVQRYYDHGHNAMEIEALRPSSDSSSSSDTDSQDELAACLIFPTSSTPPLPPWTFITLDDPKTPYSPFPPTPSDCTFTWHRNMTGIWELGYAASMHGIPPPDDDDDKKAHEDETQDPYGCSLSPLPFACLCCSPDFGAYACSCADFSADWRAPDGALKLRVVDLMEEGVWGAVIGADELHAAGWAEMVWRGESGEGEEGVGVAHETRGKRTRITEWTFVHTALCAGDAGQGEEWDVISELSSTGSWRVVDVGMD